VTCAFGIVWMVCIDVTYCCLVRRHHVWCNIIADARAPNQFLVPFILFLGCALGIKLILPKIKRPIEPGAAPKLCQSLLLGCLSWWRSRASEWMRPAAHSSCGHNSTSVLIILSLVVRLLALFPRRLVGERQFYAGSGPIEGLAEVVFVHASKLFQDGALITACRRRNALRSGPRARGPVSWIPAFARLRGDNVRGWGGARSQLPGRAGAAPTSARRKTRTPAFEGRGRR